MKKQFNDYKYGFLMEAFKEVLKGNEDKITATFECAIEKEAEQWAEMSIRILPKEEITGNEEYNQPDGQREDQAENESEDINLPF